jgi:hypothetical protein
MSTPPDNRFYREKPVHPPTVRATKSAHSDTWHIEQEFMCINGLRAWFVIATVDEAEEAEMGYTEGAFGTAEDRAKRIADALSANSWTTSLSATEGQGK